MRVGRWGWSDGIWEKGVGSEEMRVGRWQLGRRELGEGSGEMGEMARGDGVGEMGVGHLPTTFPHPHRPSPI